MSKIDNFPKLPDGKNVIGIIGGGQLGKMIALSASKAGYKTHLYCPVSYTHLTLPTKA